MDPATAESERSLALDRAKRAEQRLLGALESISEGFALYDAEDRLVYVNDAYLSIYIGRRKDYPAGMIFEETARLAARSGQIREAVGRVDAWVAERMASHRSKNYFFLRHLTDGRWIRGTETTTGDGSLVVMLADITRVKESEDALRDSERRFRAVVEASPAAINVKDLDGRYVVSNAVHAAHHGKRSDQIVGLTERELVTESSAGLDAGYGESVLERDRQAAVSGQPTTGIEEWATDPDGRRSCWLTTKLPLQDPDGEIRQILTLSHDITERKKAEQDLKDSEQRFRDFANAASDWFWEMDENLRFIYFSDDFRQIDPKIPELMIGKTRRDLIEEGDAVVDETASRDDWLAHIADLEAHRPFRNFVHARRHPDGTRRYYAVSGTPHFNKEGDFKGYRGVTQHITARKRAEQELVRREEQLSEAQRIGHMGHWHFALDETNLEWSDELWRVYGVDRFSFEPSFEYVTAMIHDDDRDRFAALRQQAAESAQPYQCEVRILRPDGEIRHVRIEGRPELGDDGKTAAVFGITQDITEQKHAEEALRQRERELSEAQRIGRIGHWRTFPNTGRITLSKEMYRLYGVDPAAFDPTLESVNRLIHEDDLRQVTDQRAQSFEAGASYTNECRIVRPDGEVRHLWSEGHPEVDDSGKVVSVFGVSQDVTEERQAEQALRESEQRSRAIVEALDRADVGVCIHKFGKEVNAVNSALVHMTGYRSRDDLVGRNWVELQGEGGTNLLEIQDEILDSLKQYRHWSGELDWMRPDGTRVTVDARTAPFPGDQVIHVLTDITDRKIRERQKAELTEQLRQAQKMEALGQLAGGTAHEINNLLHPIITFAKLAHDRVEDEKLQHYLERIMECGRRAKEVVGDVLTFARKAPGKKEHVDMTDLLARSLRFARDLVPPDIELNADFPEHSGRALANETEFIQVVLNLIKNAADASDGAGSIRLNARLVQFGDEDAAQKALAPGYYLRISIADQGCGMSEETRQHIFEPFFTTKPVGEGTGLGLAVAYGIVQDWGGGITVNSEPGKGSTFTVYLKSLEATNESGEALSA